MARDFKSNGRPPRKIKLNRSIFNVETTAKPTFRVKTLSEIKKDKECKKNAVKPELSDPVVVKNEFSSPVALSSASPIAARSVTPNVDTRTVVKSELLLPAIKLRRITAHNYNRSISDKSPQIERSVINKESEQIQEDPGPTVFAQQPAPLKKRKVSPMSVTIPSLKANSPKASPLKRRRISPIRSPELNELQLTPVVNENRVVLSSTPPINNPPSPALSLGAQSDDDLDMPAPSENSRVIIMSEPLKADRSETIRLVQNTKPTQNDTQRNVHSRLGPPRKSQIKSATLQQLVDDTLDVMSVIADDDDLFVEDQPKSCLKRSLSQDSIFSACNIESNNKGDLRSLAKKTTQKHAVGDLITSKPASKPFRIPKRNSGRDPSERHRNNSNSFSNHLAGNYISGRRASAPRNDFNSHGLSHYPPKPTRVISKEWQPVNGVSVQENVRIARLNLGNKKIYEAWLIIKELNNMRSDIDVRLLEEALKVCELVSVSRANTRLAEIVVGLYEMLNSRTAVTPMTYILTTITLCRCGKCEEAFYYMKCMTEARAFPHQEVLVHFVNDMQKCLQASPKWMFELLQLIKKCHFANPTHVFNNCLSSFAASPVEALQEITPDKWDLLTGMVCIPPNVQGAILIKNIMDKHRISMSDQATTKLLKLFCETKCTKQLLDLAHLKCTTFDIVPVFADESLDLRDVEAHLVDLVKAGIPPREDVLCQFVKKASSKAEFHLIYNLFLKFKSSSVALSVSVLKLMNAALEDWDENVNAPIEVYSTLLQVKKKKSSTLPLNLPPKPLLNWQQRRHICHSFRNNGWCSYGNNCKFSHTLEPVHGRQIPGVKSEDRDDKPQINHNALNSQFPTTCANNPLVNGHDAHQFPSFQRPSFIVPMFSTNSTPPLRLPPAARHLQGLRHRFQPQNTNSAPRFSARSSHVLPICSTSIQMFQPFAKSSTPVPDNNKTKVNRSFSWEPTNADRSKLSPLMQFQQSNLGSDKNNNSKGVCEFQHRVEHAVTSKDWSEVYLCYVEVKQDKTVRANDLMMFRSAFAKDVLAVGSNFSEFVRFIHKEKSSVKSSYSDSATQELFDWYDVEFLGSLGVSLMEKCLVTKKFDKGYEILHCLHAHNVSYFDCGKNFGAYIRDIPPSAVSIIAVKLCVGMSQEDGLLGALEVLRASNFAIPETDVSPDNVEYRIKVLQQLFTQLFDQGAISEAYEVLQHLNANASVMIPLYEKVLNHYSGIEDYDQSFKVLNEMKEKNFNLNILVCQTLYKNFLKLCLTNKQEDEAISALTEMDSKGVILNGEVWQELLLSTTDEVLLNELLQRCAKCGVYPVTFSTDTPWLCQLGCGYSQIEVKHIIVTHLKQLRQHLNTHNSLSQIKDFQITLFPKVSDGNRHQRFDGGIQSAISKNGLIVAKVLQEDLNPPLTILEQTQKQFHSKFIVDSMSLYRWFNANETEQEQDYGDDDSSSHGSIGSCLSDATRMTELD